MLLLTAQDKMSTKGVKRDTSAVPYGFTNRSMFESEKKREKTPFKHFGRKHDSDCNEYPPHIKKRKLVDPGQSESRKLFPPKKHKSKSSNSKNTTKSLSNEYSFGKNKSVANSNSEESFEENTNESELSDSYEGYGDKEKFSYEAVSGTSRSFKGSADKTLSEESDSDADSPEDTDGDEEKDIQDDDVDEGGSGKESDEYAAIKKELANIPLEDLMKIKEKLGLKVFNKIMHGSKGKSARKKKTFKRENKNRPREMSSKRQVPVVRHMDHVSQKHKFHRDPRFDDLSGQYKDEYFEKNYSFLDDIKEKEKQLVKKQLKKTADSTKKKDLQGLLMRMNQQNQVKEIKKKKAALESAWKSKEKELVKDGKLPYFLKKTEKRKLELAEKYKELQKSGKLEQYLTKKRKKNAQKERKKLPQQMN